MSLPNLVFKSIERSSGDFISRYKPPSSGDAFATLTLTVLRVMPSDVVAKLLEQEVRLWTERYPVPVFCSSFDLQDDLVDLTTVRESSYLTAIPGIAGPNLSWVLGASDPQASLGDKELLRIYSGNAHSTLMERQHKANSSARGQRLGWIVVFFWLILGPLAFLIAESQSKLVGSAVLIYSLYKLTRKALQLTGHWPKTNWERDRIEKVEKAKHYTYHCEMNPKAFARLKSENFDRISAKKNLADKERIDD